MARVSVSVPATSANLGPGFDAFGLALALHDRFSAEPADEWVVEVAGEGADDFPKDANNPVARSAARLFEEAGEEDRCLRITCDSAIPLGRGLGSSAAAIAGGLLLANAFVTFPLDDEHLFRLAAELEGHPDNVAAALCGGLTLSWADEEGFRCTPLPVSGGLAAVLVVSRLPYKTKRARKLLPPEVPHEDAAFNVGRAALLVTALSLGKRDLLACALEDRIHEQYRLEALPGFEDVRATLLASGASGAVLSGAGPTVIGLVPGDDDEEALGMAAEVAEHAREDVEAVGTYRTPVAVAIDRRGARTSMDGTGS